MLVEGQLLRTYVAQDILIFILLIITEKTMHIMKRIYATAILIITCFTQLYAQRCLYTNLSYKFNFEVVIKRTLDTDINHERISAMTLLVLNKKNKLLQKIELSPGYLFDTAFRNNSSVRSYITGINKKTEVLDYDFGDFIVADVNFDGKEDIAVKVDSGGNGGPFYAFYMQDNTGHFIINHFLTDSVGSFPKYISIKHKTITTQIHANVGQEGRKTFKYNPYTKKWRLVKWVMVDTGDDNL